MELLLILWLLMGIAAGLIAAQKGRSGAGFGCLGVLLGPIGILAAALASPASKRKTRRAKGSDAFKECPNCDHVVSARARFCPQCGYSFDDQAGGDVPSKPTGAQPSTWQKLWWNPHAKPRN